MPAYQRETRVRAPLREVWEFHSRIEGLEALTPDWMHLRVEEVRGPDGTRDPDSGNEPDDGVLETGSRVQMSLRPFNLGPRQRWTSRITRREEGDGAAVFEDVMEEGPFPTWHHSHQFYAISDSEAHRTSNASEEQRDSRVDETLVRDRVEYELPVVGGLLGPLGWLGFEPMFRERHRRTKRILEGGGREESGGVRSGVVRSGGGDSNADYQRSE